MNPQYTNVKVEGPSFPTSRASQITIYLNAIVIELLTKKKSMNMNIPSLKKITVYLYSYIYIYVSHSCQKHPSKFPLASTTKIKGTCIENMNN